MKSTQPIDFYHADFLIGSDQMSLPAVGAYIRCLCHQADKGYVTKAHMLKLCESEGVFNEVVQKFEQDSDGTYFNERMRIERLKKQRYAESRRKNRIGGNSNAQEKKAKQKQAKSTKKQAETSKAQQEVKFPFSSPEFMQVWHNYKEYRKKEHDFKFKSEISEQAALIKLSKLAEGDESKAIAIIMQTIENTWKGLFGLKIETNTQNGNGHNGKQNDLKAKIDRGNALISELYGRKERDEVHQH